RSGWGWVYKLTPPPAGSVAWQISTLWDFSGLSDGSIPMGGVVFSGGSLFGTTYSGGNTALCNAIGCGLIFKLAPAANGSWTETVLYKFQFSNDGATLEGCHLYRYGMLYATTSGC